MGSRLMDKFDFCHIAIVYFLRTTFTILSIAMFLVPTPSTIGRSLKNGAKWTPIYFPPYNYFCIIRASQPNPNINTPYRTEYCYEIFNVDNVSVLGEVLFHTFQINRESTPHLGNNYRPGSSWQIQRYQNRK